MARTYLYRKTPSGNINVIDKIRKGDIPKCAICKRKLQGIKDLHSVRLRRINLSQKRVSRIYGGYLCHRCLKNLLKNIARERLKELSIN
ncbi:50S ribosomal protein L34e [Nanobdella aerobiophila]|uniref:50S ribosomal protein L34e n=1 Tax=Nanobdella aerobiophila TaxID=2586965 RepID=A0A915SIR3_9ARCH|nr:50S ribosomal protein L34e [Nanobdella aerobiophila]BBL45827.1 50S ribosomal protein L34e [Nanobdella aerobiophila]